VFSPQDYELAARILGLPVPQSDAERAVAAPAVSAVLRNFYKVSAPMPGHEPPGVYTGATRSLNGYPNNNKPEANDQLQHRITAGITTPEDGAEVEALMEIIFDDPMLMDMFINFLESQQDQSLAAGEYLSRQRPLEYDLPNYGGQYSVLNAPASNSVPPSVAYQPLG
jgi:hypothetical protein